MRSDRNAAHLQAARLNVVWTTDAERLDLVPFALIAIVRTPQCSGYGLAALNAPVRLISDILTRSLGTGTTLVEALQRMLPGMDRPNFEIWRSVSLRLPERIMLTGEIFPIDYSSLYNKEPNIDSFTNHLSDILLAWADGYFSEPSCITGWFPYDSHRLDRPAILH